VDAVNAALGPFAIAAGLLVVAGGLKALRPHDTAVAVAKMGLAVPEWAVRVGGSIEAVLGVVALVVASTLTAALVGASYVIFFVFVAIAMIRRLPIASCGCFGRADSPPSFVHLGINAGAVVATVVVAIDPGLAPSDLVRHEVLDGVAYAVLVIVGIAAAALAVTILPRLLVLARGTPTR
jgi:hypothetical protein